VFTIPNTSEAVFRQQAEPDSRDFDMLVRGISHTGTLTGCAVTPAVGAMDVGVAAGSIYINQATVAVPGATVTVPAADLQPRFDLITVLDDGTVSVISGTPSDIPMFPVLPTDAVALASVFVPPGTAVLQPPHIIDKRVFVHSLDAASVPFTPAAGIAATNVQAAIEELVTDVGVGYVTLGTAQTITATKTFAADQFFASPVVGKLSGTKLHTLAGKAVVDVLGFGADWHPLAAPEKTILRLTSNSADNDPVVEVLGQATSDDFATQSYFQLLSSGAGPTALIMASPPSVQSQIRGNYGLSLQTGASGAGTPVVSIRGAFGQSEVLTEWMTSAGTRVASVSPTGAGSFATGTTVGGSQLVTLDTTQTITGQKTFLANTLIGTTTSGLPNADSQLHVSTVSQAIDAIVRIQADAANLTRLRFNTTGTGGGSWDITGQGSISGMTFNRVGVAVPEKMRLDSNGLLGVGQPVPVGRLHVTSDAVSRVGVIVQGFAGQTADLWQGQDSAAVVKAAIDASGRGGFGGPAVNTIALLGRAQAITENPIVARGAVGHTANLQSWQIDNGAGGGTVLARVHAKGYAHFGTSGLSPVVAAVAGVTTVITDNAVVGRGMAGQTGDLFQAQDSAGTMVAATTAGGAYLGQFLRLSTTGVDTFTTPTSASVPTKINIPLYTPASFGQVIAMGLASAAPSNARALSLFDARTVVHQPTLAVFTPNETDAIGLSWEGSNTTAYLKTLAASSITVRNNNNVDLATFATAGMTVVGKAGIGASQTAGVVLLAQSAATTDVGALIKGFAGQTGDLLQVQNSAAAVLARITSAGAATTAAHTIVTANNTDAILIDDTINDYAIRVDTTGRLNFRDTTAGVAFMRVDPAILTNTLYLASPGYVGIRTATQSPATYLHLDAGSTQGLPSLASGTIALFQRNSATLNQSLLTIIGGDTASAVGINMGDSAQEQAGRIHYAHSLDRMSFGTNNTADRMVIDSAGNVGINQTTVGAKLHVKNALAADVGIRIDMAASPSAVPFEVMDSASVLLAYLDTGARMRVALGSIGAPGYGFTGDTDTGMYSPSADYMRLVVGGATAFTVRNVGGVIQNGFFGVTAVAQPTGIVDADGSLADITTKFNSLLGKLETVGMLAVA
jgi:hypothetical protein